MNNITKAQFDRAYNQHLPAKWIQFAFRYFSKSTEKKDLKVSNIIVYILLATFLLGFFGTVMGWSRAVIGTVTFIYTGILTVLVGFLLAAVWSNNRRLKKIMKILGVTKQEYNDLVDKFYPDGVKTS
jgi:ABC-type phosphate/phosphonate transport system permease subunit